MDIIKLIRDKMMKEHLVFIYRGVVTNDNMVPLLMLLEKEMKSLEYSFVSRKRLFMFVLESLQNVTKHSDHSGKTDMSMVVYSKRPDGYTVATGNVIAGENISDLKMRLDKINTLEPGEIRAKYRQMLNNAEFTKKGGAGLGLIEMAKNTGNKLDYDFLPLDDGSSYFILSKTINFEGRGVHSGKIENPFSGISMTKIEKLMSDNNINLIWSGHITHDVGKEVIAFTETRLTEDDVEKNQRRRIFSILVESIENIAKYSSGREAEEKFGMPLAMIRLENKSYYITTGNLLLNEKVEVLQEKLNTINNYDKTGLKELFRQSLSQQTGDDDSTGNMGLIDIARKSDSKLNYRFEKINELYSYYTLTVNVDEKAG